MRYIFFALLIFIFIVIFVFIAGCADKKLKSVELTKDNFSILDNLKSTKVYLNVSGTGYGFEYFFNDPKKVEVIKLCIKNYAQPMESAINKVLEEQTDTMKIHGLYFETSKEVYCMRIAWDDNFVYGDWWRSSELLRVFKKWQLFEEISKADPAWPVFTHNFPPDTNTFQPYEGNEPSPPLDRNELPPLIGDKK